jgi:4-amino-4-deoxy-L-arabinose transferase-like glycosyltransferase
MNLRRLSHSAGSRSRVPLSRRQLSLLILFAIVGLAVRIAVTGHQGWAKPPVAGSDASEYDRYAWNLAQGRGLSGFSPDVFRPDGRPLEHLTAYRAPATSVYWAGLYRIFGHRYSVVRISQCILDTFTILVLFGIARQCFGARVALLSAAIYSVWPTAILYATELGSETQYTLLFGCFILLALEFAEREGWRWAIAAGAVLGLAMSTRGNAVLMAGLVIPWAVWQFRKRPRLILRGISITLVAFLMLVPWTVRNYEVFHAFIPFETGGGDVLLGSYNRIVANDPASYGYWIYPTSDLPEYKSQILAPNDEVKRDHVETQLAVAWIRQHPEKWWYLEESKFRRSWTPFLQPNSPRLYRYGMLLAWGPILLLFAVGCFPTAVGFLRSGEPGWLIHLGILHFVFTAEIFWGASRFRYPVEDLCIAIASATAVWIWERMSSRVPDNPRKVEIPV